jgi:NADPH:quinone reductase-like Zn-dependent oxidoreductase
LKQATRDAVEAMYGNLIAMMRAGTLRQEVDGVFALENFAQALQRVVAADRRGKVLFGCGE